MVIVKTEIKKALNGMNAGNDLFTKLESEVIILVEKAKQRALENGRKTVYGKDL